MRPQTLNDFIDWLEKYRRWGKYKVVFKMSTEDSKPYTVDKYLDTAFYPIEAYIDNVDKQFGIILDSKEMEEH